MDHRRSARRVRGAVLLARSLWSTESECSTGSFADFYERPAGHVNGACHAWAWKQPSEFDKPTTIGCAMPSSRPVTRTCSGTFPSRPRRGAHGTWRGASSGRAVDVELEVYELLEQVDKLCQRARVQSAIIGLSVRLLNLRGGKLDGDRLPDGASYRSTPLRPTCCRQLRPWIPREMLSDRPSTRGEYWSFHFRRR